MEADIWTESGGTIDGYDVGLYKRDTGVWTYYGVAGGLDGGGCGFAAVVDSADSIHTFWSASDPYGTNELVCDGVWLDSFTSIGAACLDTAGRVQCAWTRDNRLRFTVLGRPMWDVGDADAITCCDITTDTLSQPVIAYWRDGSIVVAHGVDIVGQTEPPEPAANRSRLTASVVRNVLFLQKGASPSSSASELLDATGRKVLTLRPGPNDVSQLAPGVYFITSSPFSSPPEGERNEVRGRATSGGERSAVSGRRSAVAVRKVVITR